MNTVIVTQPELIRPPANMTRYWRIDRVHGKRKHQTRRYLCTVASRSQTNPIRLARSCGFAGPILCVEMTFEEYADNLRGTFH